MSFDRQQTVAQLVLEHPVTAQVFKSHKIDFCCRGKVTVDVAAAERGLDPQLVIAELDRAIEDRAGGTREDSESAASLSTQKLIQRIIDQHHEPLRRALPFLGGLAIKVARVHGDKNPKLLQLRDALSELDENLLPHLDDEEQELFPFLIGNEPDPIRAAKDLQEMHEEHLAMAAILERLRVAADEFTLPTWACTSYRTLFNELEELESDLFRHIHLETHVLMPRFVAAA